MYAKTLVLIVAIVACQATVEARPKRSVLYAAPLVASVPVVQAAAAVPAATVVHSQVVHQNPTSVVKTEQVRSGGHASYSYSHEVKNEPVVHTHSHAVAAAVPVAHTAVAAVPATYHYAYQYPSYAHYYSPYSYVVGK